MRKGNKWLHFGCDRMRRVSCSRIQGRSWKTLRAIIAIRLGTCAVFIFPSAAPAQSVAPTPPGNLRFVSTGNLRPADVIDLKNWKETLPVGDVESPVEIRQPGLATYSLDPYFTVSPGGDGIRFRAPTDGVTTIGSGFPRSELREMTNNGAAPASWSTVSGKHSMTISEAITAVPETKKHVVAGQIHDSLDDVVVIRLEHPRLFVDVNGTKGPVLDPNYTLGKRFNVRFEAGGGKIKIYYNDSASPQFTMTKSVGGCYFKAGVYTQSNCSTEEVCGSDNYGEVVIYSLAVTHSN